MTNSTNNTGRIEGTQLRATVGGRDVVIACANKRYDGLFSWHGYGRSGRGKYASSDAALRAAAKAIGWKV